jgi:CRISPR/Cas system-associated endonuclease Cas1
MLKAPARGSGFDFKARNRRPPRDPVNALLSFAYAILLKDCFSALCADCLPLRYAASANPSVPTGDKS